jgi:hypothetical protein
MSHLDVSATLLGKESYAIGHGKRTHQALFMILEALVRGEQAGAPVFEVLARVCVVAAEGRTEESVLQVVDLQQHRGIFQQIRREGAARPGIGKDFAFEHATDAIVAEARWLRRW